MNESQLCQKLILLLPGDVQRIETSVGSGVPDMICCHKGVEYWVEAKVANPGILLRPAQLAWMMRRSRHNSLIFIMSADKLRTELTIHHYPVECTFMTRYWRVKSAPNHTIKWRDLPKFFTSKFTSLLESMRRIQ